MRRQTLLLLAALTTAEKRGWANSWTGDESWIMLVNLLTAIWMTMDQESPSRVHQTMKAIKSILMVFFIPKEFVIVNLSYRVRRSQQYNLSTMG
jgi:hypothetical protein